LSSFWLVLKQQWTIKISSPFFSIFSLVAILVGSLDHRTQFWKGAIQGPFHQSLVQIGPVASEELIKMWKVNRRTDGRSVVTIGSGELKKLPMFKHYLKFSRKKNHLITISASFCLVKIVHSYFLWWCNLFQRLLLLFLLEPWNRNKRNTESVS
jgi:hypothetical protein